MTRPTALIVGAGIAGLSAAWWLDKAGWSSIILERAPRLRHGGYSMSISGPGLETIQEMGLREALDGCALKVEELLMLDNWGFEILRLRYKEAHGDAVPVHRDDLVQLLADAIPGDATLHFSRTITHVVEEGETVQATLDNGDIITANLLIGADGIHSFVRGLVWKDTHGNCLEHLGYSFAAYDVDGKFDMPTDCVAYNFPGHMDFFYVFKEEKIAALHVWREASEGIAENRCDNFDIIKKAITGGNQSMNQLIACAEQSGVSPVIDRLTMVHLPRWSSGRVVLLGDAAHCLTLMSGQGASMAMASAQALGMELSKVDVSEVSEALKTHERRLRPAIEKLQDHSRKMAAMYIPRSTVVYYLRNLLMRFVPRSLITSWHTKSREAEIELCR